MLIVVYECTQLKKEECVWKGQSKFDEFLGLLEGTSTIFLCQIDNVKTLWMLEIDILHRQGNKKQWELGMWYLNEYLYGKICWRW